MPKKTPIMPSGWYENITRANQAARKKNSDGVKRARAKETPAQRELHNAKLAVAYRRSHAKNLFNLDTYTGRRDAKLWVAIAEKRLHQATIACPQS